MKIPVTRTDSLYPLPQVAHPFDAGADLAAAERVEIGPGERALVGTGLSMAIPEGYAGFVLPRSGLAIYEGITVINAPGLVDSGYRGELKVGLVNHSDRAFLIEPGDRIAQLVIVAVEQPEFIEVDHLEASSRGEGGFGSTGVSGV
ncbi:MAG: dUTP diphosphatase [Acidimicrobiia bacterium]|nr:MAG: dUTP diphosphatase [Acidimicrobiia bacterium]